MAGTGPTAIRLDRPLLSRGELSRSERYLGPGPRRGVAGIEHLGAAQGERTVVRGPVSGADLAKEVRDRGGVATVLPDDGLQLGRDPGDLGPHGDGLVPGSAAPFDAGPAVGPVESDIAEILGDPLRPARLEQQSGTALQAQERGCEVLDLEGGALLERGDAEAGADESPRNAH